jgi:predicted transposase YdaD
MKESVIYQEILLEGIAEGEARGIAKGEAMGIVKGEVKGKTETENQIALNMLRSNVSLELVSQFTGLTLKQVQKLQKLAAQKTKMPKSVKTKHRNASPLGESPQP